MATPKKPKTDDELKLTWCSHKCARCGQESDDLQWVDRPSGLSYKLCPQCRKWEKQHEKTPSHS